MPSNATTEHTEIFAMTKKYMQWLEADLPILLIFKTQDGRRDIKWLPSDIQLLRWLRNAPTGFKFSKFSREHAPDPLEWLSAYNTRTRTHLAFATTIPSLEKSPPNDQKFPPQNPPNPPPKWTNPNPAVTMYKLAEYVLWSDLDPIFKVK